MREECIADQPPVAPRRSASGAAVRSDPRTGDGGRYRKAYTPGEPNSALQIASWHRRFGRPSAAADDLLAGQHERVPEVRRAGLGVDADQRLGAARADQEP